MRCRTQRRRWVLLAILGALLLLLYHLCGHGLWHVQVQHTQAYAGPVYLGLDMSTQSLKCTAIAVDRGTGTLAVVHTASLNYDDELPVFGTHGGVVHRTGGEDGAITSPTLMWVAALDKLLLKLQRGGFDFASVAAVSVSGQQHGSVYWAKGASKTLGGLDPRQPLAQQLVKSFAVAASPVWMDSSTGKQCKDREERTGGADKLARLTGSRAYERFTGNQIAKMAARTDADGRSLLDGVERISIVSSFAATLLAGTYAGIDSSDAGGMNLMNILSRKWDAGQLDLTMDAPPGTLARMLGPEPVDPRSIIGPISTYFVNRFGFKSNCWVAAASGDNPNSVAGVGLSKAGDLAVSLGTSDTVFGITADPKPGLHGHVFVNPVDPTSSYFAMLVFKNGGVVRQRVRDEYCTHDEATRARLRTEFDGDKWAMFTAALEGTPPGNANAAGVGQIGIYVDDPEITPHIARIGTHRFHFNRRASARKTRVKRVDIAGFPDPRAEVRAAVESRFLSMRLHAAYMGIPAPTTVIATGGASQAPAVLQVMADVWGVPVFVEKQPDAASFGAALRAAHAGQRYAEQRHAHRTGHEENIGAGLTFSEVTKGAFHRTLAAEPNPVAHSVYQAMLPHYELAEQAVRTGH